MPNNSGPKNQSLAAVLLLGIGCLLLVSFGCMLVHQLEKSSNEVYTQPAIAPVPVAEHKEDAAFRWNLNFKNLYTLRFEQRGSLRNIPPVQTSGISADSGVWEKVFSYDISYIYAEARFIFYRRLWQRILPTRAGPVAA